ncbi:beta-eliminating lyase [Colletotrichum godetiae]|uniref:Beta-eliminating lyase n=1 Tax=Colletotrichum godetiae TaxID=1209918 RepID=A0AAJ0EXC4_9PEZI|nr:beta-eliminating lyase [Colletotrichum godetiae]KAK1690879.1 beta-eliminating lyase [Colletotrichum godetiae]
MIPDDKKASILWGSPQQTGAAFDFRSDVITTPSLTMLAAITHTTLSDDVYSEDPTTSLFESSLAATCGHAAAAFVLTGTMANQLALRTLLTQPPHAVLADASAHILHWEAGGVAHLSGAMVQGIRPRNGLYLTLQDIEKHAVLTDDVHKCPTRVVSIENTSSGVVVPLLEMRRIREWTSARGIAVHMDGARLWEAVSAGAGSLEDFGRCCDVLTLDFSKNLAAPMGAMVLGSAELMKRLRRMRKSIGGGMRQAGVLAAAARQAVLENFGPGTRDVRGVLERSRVLAAEVGRMWISRGGVLLKPVETNMVWLDLRGCGVGVRQWNEAGRRRGVKLDGKRVVLHHQVGEGAMRLLGDVMDEVLGRVRGVSAGVGGLPKARL